MHGDARPNPSTLGSAYTGDDRFDVAVRAAARSPTNLPCRSPTTAATAWWREENCAPRDQPAAFEGRPDLVVEVLSPSTRRLDGVRKRNDYPQVGVPELWLIDPDTSAMIIRTQPDGEQILEIDEDGHLRSPMLDAFTVRLGDLTRR
jgi:hypothetical protein